MNPTLELTKQLISCASITPHDAGCQEIIIQRLEKLGFNIERLIFGKVDNLWAKRGNSQPTLVFAGHTDVVPTGPLEKWQSDPFKPEIRDGFLYGRGAADMKGSLAAMLTAVENFINENANSQGSIAFLITSDEEGPAINGTRKVVEHLINQGEKIDYCIVGEPSSTAQLGDVIKNGRRGSLGGTLTIYGKQGHVAYPHLAENPIHRAFAALTELTTKQWDNGNKYFPPTGFQISNIHAGTGANNVIPAEIIIEFNFRHSTEFTAEQLQQAVEKILNTHQLKYHINWHTAGKPFLTKEGKLVSAVTEAIQEVMYITPELSTSGGTSDGRFIADMNCEIVELGPCNNTIHQINECINIRDLEKLTSIYQRILTKLFGLRK